MMQWPLHGSYREVTHAYSSEPSGSTASRYVEWPVSARLLDAERAVTKRRSVAERLARDASADDMLDKAEVAHRAAQDRASNLKAALAQEGAHLAKLESELAELLDKKTLAATVAEIAAMTTDLETVATEMDTVVSKLGAIAERAAGFIPEAGGLLAFTTASKTQIPDAVALITRLMNDHAAAVLAGTGPAALKRPEPVTVVAAIPPAPTVQLFCTRPVRWIAADGATRIGQKFTDVSVTPSAASRGLACGALVALDSPLRRQNYNTVEGNPRADLALDLDAEPVREAAPVLHEAFERPTIGEACIFKIARDVVR
jgi:ABC-type transporter Mla subunit MlaD